MRQAVKFLLDRMDTHPEEFYEHRSIHAFHHWVGLINDNKKFFTEEEAEAIRLKLSEINMDRFSQAIAERLLAPEPDSEPVIGEFDAMGRLQQSFGAAPIRAEGQRVTYGMQNRYQLEDHQYEHMKAQYELLKAKAGLEAKGEL